ncbi:MAG: hypothetical protein KGM98_08965 [Bacteroidota bacterium]|nr:hypothetical protein [Bacteroidota bacterium]
MVIGNGMIATRFSAYKNKEDILIFASGVSNSKDTHPENFDREFRLLEQTLKANPDKMLVYFSTCSIQDPDLASAPYVIHKKRMEEFIQGRASRFLLFRISNLAGMSNNPYTLLNYFIFAVLNNQPITVWERAYRNIIGIDDMYLLVDDFIKRGATIEEPVNIANPENYSVLYILDCIETHLGKKAIRRTVTKGADYKIDISAIEEAIERLNIRFGTDYLPRQLKMYYHSR